MRTFFWDSIIFKICNLLFLHKILLVLKYLSLYTGSLSNLFFNTSADFIPDFTIYLSQPPSFIKKDMYVLSSELFVYPLVSESNMHNGLTLSSSM